MTRFLLIVLLCLVWGSTWLAIKIGLQDSPPFLGAAFRFVIASLILLGLAGLKRLSWPKDSRGWFTLLWPGFFLYFLSYGFVYWGEQHINSSLAALLFATFPFWVAILSNFMLTGERLTIVRILSLVVGFSGIVIIFWDSLSFSSSPHALLGMLALLGSGVSSAYASVMVKRDLHHTDPIIIAAGQMTFGAVLLLLVGLLTEDLHSFRITSQSIGALLYLALFGSALAFVTYYYLLKTSQATKLSLIAFVTPITALLLGGLVNHEVITLKLLLGTFLVVGGIVLLVFVGKEQIPAED